MTLPNGSKRKIFDGRYEILSIVGRGADSVVYRARHISGTQQEVAIKVLINRDGSSTLTDKLRREALTLVSCRHRYVVRLDDFHSIKDLCYLSMEFAQQGDLARFLLELPDRRLPAPQIELFLNQCLEALDFVHATGVIHRDIKPENILILNDREIRLADFGLALLPGDEVQLEELRKAVGSFDYLAPEVLQGVRYDTISDLYSLGVCFYEAATGIHPFANAPIAEKLKARADSEVRPITELAPNLAPHVAAVITTLMKYAAGERFHSASEALRALEDPTYRAASFKVEPVEATAAAVVNANEPQSYSEPSPTNRDAAANSAAANSIDPFYDELEEDLDDIDEIGSFFQPKDKEVTPSRSPANSDPLPERDSPPTEKIDLERIKAIIAQDAANKTAKGNSTHESNAPAQKLAHKDKKAKDKGAPKGAVATTGFKGAGSSIISKAIGRFIGVAVAFAVLTIGGVYSYNSLFNGGGSDKISQENGEEDTSPDNAENLNEKSADASLDKADKPEYKGALKSDARLLNLPEGRHTGTVSGLSLGEAIPMLVISKPKEEKVILMLGIDGWTPAVADSSSQNEDTESDGLTFRSNGLILKLKRVSSEGEISGTLSDVVSGDTGKWKISDSR